ncbi:MAG: vitamin K epoxide reductase family protein [Planctomycetota bacterium]
MNATINAIEDAPAYNYPPAWVVNLLRVTAIIALGIALFLAWSAYQVGDIAGCSGGGIWDCGHVLHSRWSKIFGLPVSIPASGLYMSLLAASAFLGKSIPNRVRNLSWSIVTVLAISAGAAALWFISLQIFVLGHLCKYCMGVHACGLIIAAVVMTYRPLGAKLTSSLGAMGFAAAACLMITQAVTKPAPTHKIEFYGDDQVAAATEAPEEDDVLDFDMDMEEDSFDAPGIDDVAEIDDDDQTLTEGQDVGESKEDPTKPVSIEPPAEAASDSGADTISLNGPVSAKPEVSYTPQPPLETAKRDPPPKAAAKPKRVIMYPGIKANLNVAQWPILGDLNAQTVIVELFDYTCPHCRAMNGHINVARQRFGDQLAVVVLPVPLNIRCNPTAKGNGVGHEEACEIARLALALWRTDAKAFPLYHDWLFAAGRSRTLAEARAYAQQLVDPVRLQYYESQSPLVNKFIDRHIKLYQRSGEGTLPKIFTEKLTIKGQMRSADELCDVLQNHLGLQPILR